MRNLFSVVSVFIFILVLAACGPDHNPIRLTGGAQKGPYQPGSPVSCTKLDAEGYPTTATFSTTTDATGMFTLNLTIGVYQCQASGFYWKEDEGKYSGAATTMYALVNVTNDGANTAFINPRTNFAAKRAIALIATVQDGGTGMDPGQAILQAETEINDMGFSIPAPADLPLSTRMDLLGGDNAANREVFRVDCALMYASQIKAADPSERDAQLQSLLNRGALEVASDGAFSADFKALIAQAEKVMNPEVCKTYLQKYITDNGLSGIAVPDIQAVIDTDGNRVANADQPDPEMVDVPAGPFWMGCGGQNPYCTTFDSRELPYHEVTLSGYKIDRFEVTAGQYKQCVDEATCTAAGNGAGCNFGSESLINHPINCVTWEQANSYCVWVGKRLPTEAEWEMAARGTDGRPEPWGTTTQNCSMCIMKDGSGPGCGHGGTWIVGSKYDGRSPFGAMDMVGNVWEYVWDWFSVDYYSQSPTQDPPGPMNGSCHVVRGGSWNSVVTEETTAIGRRCDSEYFEYGNAATTGFRCAKSSVEP